MKKVFSIVLIMLLLLSTAFCASAAERTMLTVGYFMDGKELSLEVKTNQTSGVGGLDIQIEYDPAAWELVSGSAKSQLKDGDLSVAAGKVRVMWFTITGEELSETLLKLSLKKVKEDAAAEEITLTVNDYYDQTLEMADIPYEIQYTEDTALKPAGKVWLLWLLVPVAAVGGCFVYIKRKKTPAKRRKPQLEME